MNVRPQQLYRQEFRQRILAERPQSVLEVGCRDGKCLQELLAAGVHAEGIEVDPAHVAELRARGLCVHAAKGETLPFAAGAFDLVVSEYCAHHFADLTHHLAEAMRVARRGVFLLDPWYDLSIPSQQLAERWDRWFKAIDRAAGKVHHDSLAAQHFRGAMPNGSRWSFECRHVLHLVAVDDAKFASENEPYLAQVATRPDDLAELQAITAARAQSGLTDDGAIMVLLRAAGSTCSP